MKSGKTFKDLIEDDDLAPTAGRHMRLVQTLEKTFAPTHRDWHSYTHVYYGPPGTGKTRRAKYEAERKYGAENVFWLPPPEAGKLWWDGYNGEPAVIIDEYYGSFMQQTLLQRICDRYPLRVPTKGSTTPLLAKEIWITSNFEPVAWYKKGLGPLARRLSGDLGVMEKMTTPWSPPAIIVPVPAPKVVTVKKEKLPKKPVPTIDLTQSEGSGWSLSEDHSDTPVDEVSERAWQMLGRKLAEERAAMDSASFSDCYEIVSSGGRTKRRVRLSDFMGPEDIAAFKKKQRRMSRDMLHETSTLSQDHEESNEEWSYQF